MKKMPGKKPRPSWFKGEVLGEKNKDRINNNEPRPHPNIPEPPKHLSKVALKEYHRIAKELYDLGLLTNIDRTALAAYCDAYAQWVRYSEMLQKSGPLLVSEKNPYKVPYQSPLVGMVSTALKNMMSILTEFGMTPSSRSRINVPKPEKDKGNLF